MPIHQSSTEQMGGVCFMCVVPGGRVSDAFSCHGLELLSCLYGTRTRHETAREGANDGCSGMHVLAAKHTLAGWPTSHKQDPVRGVVLLSQHKRAWYGVVWCDDKSPAVVCSNEP